MSSNAGRAGRFRVATAVGGRELLRDPVLLGLLVFLPAYFVGVWGWMVPADPVQVTVPAGDGAVTVGTDFVALMMALVAPVTGALLVGIAGLFLVQRSREVDDRLSVVGYRGPELLASRFAILAGIAAVVVAATAAMSAVHHSPTHPGWFVVALLLAAGTYGSLGVLTGLFLDRMAGVYLLLFAPMLDILLLQMPLADSPWWADWLPGRHAAELALSASFADSVATAHAVWGVLVVFALAGVAALVTARR